MFEEFEKEEEKEEKESRLRLIRDSVLVIVALVVVVGLAYFIWRPRAKPNVSNLPSARTAAPAGPPDVTRDLEIVRAIMGKDPSGIRVMWSVKIRNKSAVYTYSNLKYQATFVGPDGRTLAVTEDTIKDQVEPGGEKTIPSFIDGLYNSNASTYNFRLVSADARAE